MPEHERASYTLDRDLRFVSATPTALGLWGKRLADVVGKTLIEVFPVVEGGDTHQGLLQALASFKPIRLRTMSFAFGAEVDVEIYPTRAGVQVIFGPAWT